MMPQPCPVRKHSNRRVWDISCPHRIRTAIHRQIWWIPAIVPAAQPAEISLRLPKPG